jgi:hypothetical protein
VTLPGQQFPARLVDLIRRPRNLEPEDFLTTMTLKGIDILRVLAFQD